MLKTQFIRAVVICGFAALLLACAPSNPTMVLQDLGSAADGVQITSITVSDKEFPVSDELAEQLKSKFAKAMPQCATGRRPHSLEIIVENYEGGGAGQAFLIGARSVIDVQFIIRPVGSEVSVGDYQMQEILAGGGLLGAAAMAQSEAILSQNLAERLCKEVWGIHLQP